MLQKLKDLSKTKKITYSLILIGLIWFTFFALPRKLFNTPTSFVIEDSKGELMGASIASDGQWRFPHNELVSEKFVKCITSFEDKRFFYHPGIDPIAMGRAIKQDIKAKSVVSGGSTLTMQVIRLSRNKPRTFWQKIVETVLAVRLELSYSKDEILALYASNAPFGTNVVGLDAAAWRYFGRSPEDLSWGEMAALAVLPNSPSLVHPGKNRLLLQQKRNKLLDNLVSKHIIDKSTCDLAKLEPIPDRPLSLPKFAPHLLNRFKIDYKDKPELFTETRTRTTLQLDLQQKVTDILSRHYVYFKANGIENAAALVLDVETGNALAYGGNVIGAGSESQVDIIPAPRSPGSTLKPLLYASMLTEGDILPNTLIADIPTQIAGYTPENYDLGYDGAVPASRALARSLNIPAVKMLQQYRFERFYDKLKQLGVSTLNKPSGHYGLSLILGGGENSMWDLAGIYAGLARILNHQSRDNGKYAPEDIHKPIYCLNQNTKERNDGSLQDHGVLDAGAIWATFNAMEEVMRPGEELLWQQFSSSQRIAWKTGTSFGFRDGWAIGLTPKYVVAVWVGNADGEGRPGLTGISAAAPILFDIFRLLPAGNWFDPPYDKLRKLNVCRLSGYKAGRYCEMTDSVWVPKAGINTKICPFHQLIHLDRTGMYRVDADCEMPELMQNKSWFVLPPSMEWYYKSKNQYYKSLPPFKPDCTGADDQGVAMEIIYPKNGSKIYVPVEFDETKGKTIFSAAHRNAQAKIFWHIDDQFIETTKSFHQIAVNPRPGKHKLTLVDENGERLELRFEILQK
ncbi:penicillin-binding protein 1C [Solitalea longa]|uniref:peptidoglycan glycosyltransferase n=1 Tax=Solitalea longa TaxID=2079460 RepID=A0A2S5A6R2_9SPHI|nr:penicillin-binding protein 1C [Solitalea longa]POY38032.1 penicillin-binding protein 1C [Solitalea longa]